MVFLFYLLAEVIYISIFFNDKTFLNFGGVWATIFIFTRITFTEWGKLCLKYSVEFS